MGEYRATTINTDSAPAFSSPRFSVMGLVISSPFQLYPSNRGPITPINLPKLRIGEIHLGMLRLKLPQHLHLFLFLARRLSHLLLSLIVHHFLHHAPCLAIQIAQLAVLRRDLRDVDFGR